MKKIGKTAIALWTAFVVCVSFAACSLQGGIQAYSSHKEPCYLNVENVTQFFYKGNAYTVLEETLPNGGIGEWIGYIRRLAAVDEAGKVLLQENIEDLALETLTDLVEKAPEAAYIIPFLNVYAAPNTDDFLIVDVNGGYHKAVANEIIKDSDTVFDFKNTEKPMRGTFAINPRNATQLLCGSAVYQVTPETVSEDELGTYLDTVAESVAFDTETKRPLSKDELNEIDWSGESAGQGRALWLYTAVYEICGTDRSEALAVRINNCCYIAKRQ